MMRNLTLIDKAFLLKKSRLFSELDLDLLLAIADKLGLVHFEKGKKIFNIHEEASRMFLIVEGQVEILDEAGAHLATLHAEDFFGDESLFSDKPRAYTALSLSDTLLLTLSQTHLMTLISESPSVAVGLLSVYANAMGFRRR